MSQIQIDNDNNLSILDEKEDTELFEDVEIKYLIPRSSTNYIEKQDKNYFKNTKHKYWTDALRVFSNFLIILLHSSYQCRVLSFCEKFTPKWNGAVFWDSISRSSIPLFITISGMFLLDPEKEISISMIYKKYVYRITRCLLFWNIFYITIVKFFVNVENKQFIWNYNLYKETLEEFFLESKYHLWYLYLSIGLHIITPIIRPIVVNKSLTKYYIILIFGVYSSVSFIATIINDYFPHFFMRISFCNY